MVLPSSLWIFTIEKTFSEDIDVRMHSTMLFCWREAAQWRAVPNTLWDFSAASLSISGTALRRALSTFSSTSLVCRSLSRMNSSADFASYNTNKGNLGMVKLVQINYSNNKKTFLNKVMHNYTNYCMFFLLLNDSLHTQSQMIPQTVQSVNLYLRPLVIIFNMERVIVSRVLRPTPCVLKSATLCEEAEVNFRLHVGCANTQWTSAIFSPVPHGSG